MLIIKINEIKWSLFSNYILPGGRKSFKSSNKLTVQNYYKFM